MCYAVLSVTGEGGQAGGRADLPDDGSSSSSHRKHRQRSNSDSVLGSISIICSLGGLVDLVASSRACEWLKLELKVDMRASILTRRCGGERTHSATRKRGAVPKLVQVLRLKGGAAQGRRAWDLQS